MILIDTGQNKTPRGNTAIFGVDWVDWGGLGWAGVGQ